MKNNSRKSLIVISSITLVTLYEHFYCFSHPVYSIIDLQYITAGGGNV